MVINADEKIAQGEFTKNDLISDMETKVHSRRYLEGKDIDSYLIKRYRFLEWGTSRVPKQLSRPTFPELYTHPKIMRGRVTGGIYDDTGLVCNDSIVLFVRFTDLSGVNNKSIQSSIKKNNSFSRMQLENKSMRYDMKYLLAILNSSYAMKYLNNIRRHRLKNYFYPDDFRKLPIADISLEEQKPLVYLVENILAMMKDNNNLDCATKQDRILHYRRQIDHLVYKLYNFTPDEIEIIENSMKGK